MTTSKRIPLILGIDRPIGKAKKAKPPSGQASAQPQKIDEDLKKKILERDGNTCQCCGFTSKKYQDIHFINHNKFDHQDRNLATICIFCKQCFNLQDVSTMRSGILIWLPEIPQAMLHHITRAIYVARISQGPMADAARASLDILMARRDQAKERLGTDEAHILASVLQDYLGEKHYYYRTRKLEGLRLLPLDRRIIKEAEMEFNQFPQILAYWRSKDGPFGGKTPPQWINIYKNIKAISKG